MATTVVPVTLAQAATEPEFADITSSRALPNRNVKQQFIDGGSTPGNQPDNVLIGQDGRPRVVDFGLARVGMEELPEPSATEEHANLRSLGRLSLVGVVSGTPGYMSPEQYRGGNVDTRSDQWSLCASLFEALYGYLPFSGVTVQEYADNVHGLPRHPPRDTAVPEDIHRVLLRGLSPDPEKRFPSIGELLSALDQEHREDLASGSIARQRFVKLLIAVSIGLYVMVQIRQWYRPINHREALTASAILILAALTGGLWGRQTVLRHRIHRHAWIVLFAVLLQNCLQRIFSMIANIPMSKMVPFEMIVIAGTLTVGTATVFRRFFIAGPLTVLYSFVGVLGFIPSRMNTIVYLLLLVLYFYYWSRAAQEAKARHTEHAKRASQGHRPRRPPSRPSVPSTPSSPAERITNDTY